MGMKMSTWGKARERSWIMSLDIDLIRYFSDHVGTRRCKETYEAQEGQDGSDMKGPIAANRAMYAGPMAVVSSQATFPTDNRGDEGNEKTTR